MAAVQNLYLIRLLRKCYAICHWKYLEIQTVIFGPEKSALCINDSRAHGFDL